MKKILLLLLAFYTVEVAQAQKGEHVIGLQMGSGVSSQGWFSPFDNPTNDLTYAGGIFYDWQFSTNMGLSVLANHRKMIQDRMDYCDFCFRTSFDPERYIYNYLEVPIALTVNTSKEAAKWKTNLVLWYSFG